MESTISKALRPLTKEERDELPDRSFDPLSAYASHQWAAFRLGLTVGTFRNRLEDLQSEGFPQVDRLINLFQKADIDTWIYYRQQIPDPKRSDENPLEGQFPGMNLGGLRHGKRK